MTKEILKISKLDSSTGRALHQFAEFLGSNPVQAWNFFRLSLATAQVESIIAAMSKPKHIQMLPAVGAQHVGFDKN